MLTVFRSSWPLLLGVLLLMVGNGMQGTLLGVRGGIEGIPTSLMALVMAGYFGGFVVGSRTVPGLIQRVGHVRVFAALASMISAVLVMYAAAPHWLAWALLRFLIGFCFCGVYIVAESWLNAGATNENRGLTMSTYMIVQMSGLVTAQFLMNFGDPGGWMLFVVPSVLVSLAFTPILLATTPAPRFETIAPMSMRKLFRASPLGCVGIFLMGGVFAALQGMSPVWGSVIGMNVRDVSAFVAAIWLGGLACQYPIGWLSDRTDRRVLIMTLAMFGAAITIVVFAFDVGIWGYLLAAALLGGVANPTYSLLIAYTNDFLDASDMAAGSAGLLLINGAGSFFGPIVTAWLMAAMGPDGFWAYMGVLLLALSGYAAWRMTRGAAPAVADTGAFAMLSPTATTLAVETALAQAGDPATHPEEEFRMTPQEINRFWLDEVGPKGWYEQSDELDQQVRARFMSAWQDARQLTRAWADTPEGTLASLILTDQFPRNMFRGDSRSFATDPLAISIAESAIAAGHDLATPEPARQFFYMPFEHAEDLALQDRAVALFAERMPGENLIHAQLHRDTIATFGRFPWRNAALGRETTPAEQALLDAGGYGALVSGKVKLADPG